MFCTLVYAQDIKDTWRNTHIPSLHSLCSLELLENSVGYLSWRQVWAGSLKLMRRHKEGAGRLVLEQPHCFGMGARGMEMKIRQDLAPMWDLCHLPHKWTWVWQPTPLTTVQARKQRLDLPLPVWPWNLFLPFPESVSLKFLSCPLVCAQRSAP